MPWIRSLSAQLRQPLLKPVHDVPQLLDHGRLTFRVSRRTPFRSTAGLRRLSLDQVAQGAENTEVHDTDE